MRLTSHERKLLALYITANETAQQQILRDAIADPKTGAPLIHAYMNVLGLI